MWLEEAQMKLQLRLAATLGLALALVLAAPSTGSSTTETDSDVEVVQTEIDLTAEVDQSLTIPPEVLTPEAARNIGPGSALVITIPGEGRFGCTANFVWNGGGKRYLGSAGHCFLPGSKKATHGEGADYDASGVEVRVCVEGCEGNFRTMLLVGKFVTLNGVAYARQTDPTGTEDVGNDFGVVEIPRAFADLVRPSLPVFGGPDGADTLKPGAFGCHYGHGLVVGETFVTKARVGVGGGGDEQFWMGDFAGAFGDSGSGLVKCEPEGATFKGQGAVGVLTHLGLAVCPCKVNFKKRTVEAQQGVIFGTTVARSVELAREAGLSLSLVRAPGS
jgi:hypothetical protein